MLLAERVIEDVNDQTSNAHPEVKRRMARYKVVCIAVAIVMGFTVCLPMSQASPGLLGDLLKVLGIAYVVNRFGGDMDRFINKVANQSGVEWEGTTKVVPIFSVGAGAYVGAAQVVGPQERVSTVKAAAQVETRIGDLGARLLIPISTKKASGSSLNRVEGVGVTALLDFKI